ncbi:uncharacterized protein LOC123214163 isoform X2 [Mangifera indica]|uniref:uncharacterized protein LOC123214163 isoform X2 n=1 Tax=Mangifera indica TaxID=29780 RepID=UPI001CF9DCC1|nr:uncharacterized protein LOC123214163 isoform X2 [Mangifera indica]
MAKPKEILVEDEEVKSEGLEIISIGSLYEGPWEKKYWSSSRGKDRYPYPVGYHAVRAHNGNTCKMEIHEGPKGPLFMITAADGPSCSGQTPDIAWDKFQKKYCPRMKTWHGKRLSCKIDGVEFFGFKNSFVQRLLRELVANVNGTAERNLLSHSLCNGAPIREHDKHTDAGIYLDLQSDIERTKITKKRSRREIKNTKPVGRNGLKRPRSQGLECDSKATSSVLVNQRNQNHGSSMPCSTSKEGNDFCKNQEALSASEHLNFKAAEGEDGCLSANYGFPSVSIDFSAHLSEGNVPVQEWNKLVGSVDGKSSRVTNNLVEEGKPLDRSKNFSFQVAGEGKAGDALVPNDSFGVETINLFAPDTLDSVQDNSAQSSPTTEYNSTYNLKEDFTTANNAIPEGLVTDSHPKEEIDTFNSTANPGKSDSDSIGQEIATAMMTVLLPQAIPLLNKKSSKKKATIKASESLSCMVNPKKNDETSHFVDASFPAAMLNEKTNVEMEENMQIPKINLGSVPSSEHSMSVVLDSFEDACGDHITNEIASSSQTLEADLPGIDKEKNLLTNQKEYIVDANESSVCAQNNKSKIILCDDEINMVLNKNLPEGVSESVLGGRFSGKKVFFERDQDVCVNFDQNSVGIGFHLVEKDIEIESNCTEDASDAHQRGMSNSVQLSGKDNSAKNTANETVSVVQAPKKVYSRKVSKKVPIVKNFSGPLSESIICRNFESFCVPKTHCAAETLAVSVISEMKSSDDKQHEGDFGAKTRLEEQCHVSSVLSQNSAVFGDCKVEEFCNFSDPYAIHMKKSEGYSDEELFGPMKHAESNASVVPQKQEISFSGYNCNAKDVKVSSDIKLQKNVEINNELQGIVDFAGCYFHPMPISSVLLATKGDEIYICVLCGLLNEKNRTLFIYKVAIQEQSVGCPSFIGHTSVMLPFLKDIFGRDIALETSCLQFTPDGQCLVLLGSIKTPYCREGRIDCLCSACSLECSEKNAVKIVQAKSGYVSVVANLKTDDSVQCMLVCEPYYVIAVGESGRMHVWEMNSTWSAQIEEIVISVDDYIYPCIVELKKIPNSASLVVGHNGFGQFGLWDISRLVFLSRFSAPSTSIYQFFPINFFCWPRNVSISSGTNLLEKVKEIVDASKFWFSKHHENNHFLPLEREDIAIWLLVSTASVSEAQHNHISSDCQTNPVRVWRLALLVKNTVILGSTLDPRTHCAGLLPLVHFLVLGSLVQTMDLCMHGNCLQELNLVLYIIIKVAVFHALLQMIQVHKSWL